MLAITEAMAPSQLLLGLTMGASLCLPIALPNVVSSNIARPKQRTEVKIINVW